jgi:hypothetical protein
MTQEQNPTENKKQRRVGEILESEVTNRTRTTQLDDTNYEDGNPRWGTARFHQRMVLEVRVRDSGDRFTFDYDSIEALSIGRRDPNTGSKPDIDLEKFDALNKGVSRRHATITRREGSLMLIDEGSPNGTFLNGQKLVSQQPRILRDGDDIRFGHLVVRISYRRSTPQTPTRRPGTNR